MFGDRVRALDPHELLTYLFRTFDDSRLAVWLRLLAFAWQDVPYSTWQRVLEDLADDRRHLYDFLWFASESLKAKEGQTMYEFKQTSSNPDDRAEARMAARLAEDGYDVHFRANDKGGDLEVGGVKTEVKHSHGGNVANQMNRAAQQGVEQVIIDGSTKGLTKEQVRVGIDKYEALAQEWVEGESRLANPKLRDLQTAFIVMGDGTMYIYHRGTSLKKAH